MCIYSIYNRESVFYICIDKLIEKSEDHVVLVFAVDQLDVFILYFCVAKKSQGNKESFGSI